MINFFDISLSIHKLCLQVFTEKVKLIKMFGFSSTFYKPISLMTNI